MEWDLDNFETPVVASGIVNKWDGEDEDESVKDNWEDDDDDKKKEENQKKQQIIQSKKPKTRLEEKIEEKERKEMEKRMRLKTQELNEELVTENMTLEQIQAEKLRRQKLQEEADLEVAKEMLGLTDDELNMDKMNPKTKEEFAIFKEALCKKIIFYKKSEHFPTFIEELLRELSANLTSSELKKLKMLMDNMFNEKIKVEKLEKGRKSKSKTKAKLRIEGNDMLYDEYSAYTIDDDYDDFAI